MYYVKSYILKLFLLGTYNHFYKRNSTYIFIIFCLFIWKAKAGARKCYNCCVAPQMGPTVRTGPGIPSGSPLLGAATQALLRKSAGSSTGSRVARSQTCTPIWDASVTSNGSTPYPTTPALSSTFWGIFPPS